MSEAKATILHEPVQVGDHALQHRIVLAPLTRLRSAQPGNIPTDLMAEYYGQRASEGGLLIAEATGITQEGQGYPGAPGIHSDAQVQGWKKVTSAVHKKGGVIFLQLWHVGRVSHSSFQPDGRHAPAPSAVAISSGQGFTADGRMADYETPRELTVDEIQTIIAEYKTAAVNAKRAGFDGVEVHGANGYLIDQFLNQNTNLRDDAYGGSVANRTRFALEVVEAVLPVFGAGGTGIRLSPWGTFGDVHSTDRHALFSHLLSALEPLNLAYVHLVTPRANGASTVEDGTLLPVQQLQSQSGYAGRVILAGGFDKALAVEAVSKDMGQLIAFGRDFISNPDLPLRLKLDAPLNKYDRATFYGGTAAGYTDYPFLDTTTQSA